jgi:hypothetical protein
MTTDIAINGTIASVLPVDVMWFQLYEHRLVVPMRWCHLLQYQWSSERETILNIIEVTVNPIKIVW